MQILIFFQKKYIGNLQVKVWAHPNTQSFMFLLKFLKYQNVFSPRVSLNVVFRIVKKQELLYDDKKTVDKFCYNDGDYCVGLETSNLFFSFLFLNSQMNSLKMILKTQLKQEYFCTMLLILYHRLKNIPYLRTSYNK